MTCSSVVNFCYCLAFIQIRTFMSQLYKMCDNELRKVLFLALSATFLFVYEISPEPLNGFAPNSQARRVWSLAGMSLKVKVKGQGHQDKNGVFGGYIGNR